MPQSTTLKWAWRWPRHIGLPAPAAQEQERLGLERRGGQRTIGGGLGVDMAKTPYDICSVPDCALLLAVAGRWRHLADGAIGAPALITGNGLTILGTASSARASIGGVDRLRQTTRNASAVQWGTP